MKKSILLLLSLLLLFVSCSRTSDIEGGLFSDRAARIETALGGMERFIRADEDFVETNLGDAAYLENSAIYLGDTGEFGEWGIFELTDSAHVPTLKQAIQEYLKEEEEAIRSLASLYPAKELEQRLTLYRDAVVGNKGRFVYYFVLEKEDQNTALAAI